MKNEKSDSVKKKDIVSLLRCESCLRSSMVRRGDLLECASCHATYPIVKEKVFYKPDDQKCPTVLPKVFNKNKWSFLRKKHYSFLKENLKDISKDAVVLDLGVGPGQFSDLTDRFFQCVGVDFVPYGPVDVVCDINKSIPFGDGSFNVVVASNTLEHIPDTSLLLSEMFRIIKKDGTVIITIPFLLDVHQEPYDFHRYTPYMLRQLFADAGFCNIEIRSLNTPLETYKTMQLHYFMLLFDRTEQISNPLLRYGTYIAVKILWMFSKMINIIGSPVMSLPAISEKYTLSYGIVARKPR